MSVPGSSLVAGAVMPGLWKDANTPSVPSVTVAIALPQEDGAGQETLHRDLHRGKG
jgi:hypothetical protein